MARTADVTRQRFATNLLTPRQASLGLLRAEDGNADGNAARFTGFRPPSPLVGNPSRRRAESNHRLPGSARVAAVNRSTSPGQRPVQSGLVSDFTTMKIITVWAEAEIATTRLSGA